MRRKLENVKMTLHDAVPMAARCLCARKSAQVFWCQRSALNSPTKRCNRSNPDGKNILNSVEVPSACAL